MFNGKKLGDYLKENGISQLALAKRLGCSEGAVRHIIVGIKQPSLAMLTEIAQMMGCKLDDLVTAPQIEKEEE